MHTESQLHARTRAEIKYGLHRLPDESVSMFMRMYSHKDLGIGINDAVDKMPTSQLQHALLQVCRTTENLAYDNSTRSDTHD